MILRIIRYAHRVQLLVDGLLVWEGTEGEWSFALANAKFVKD